MPVNNVNSIVKEASTAFAVNFDNGLNGKEQDFLQVATKVQSQSASTGYGFLQQVPKLEEWLAERMLKTLDEYDYEVKNKLFESSIVMKRADFEDNDYGKYSPLFEDLGRAAAEHPNEHVFKLLANGLTGLCFDGQPFFSEEHVIDDVDLALTASNYYTPADPVNKTTQWYLLDTNRSIKPLIWQERIMPSINTLHDPNSEYVFMNDKYVYGVRARGNAGYGFWQLAAMSDMDLTPDNFNTVYEGMIALKGSNGDTPLRITPKVLVVPPSLRQKAYEVIKRERLASGESNINFEIVDIMVCPYL